MSPMLKELSPGVPFQHGFESHALGLNARLLNKLAGFFYLRKTAI
ncbi:hypothetical protein [Comamonas thiooxydans]|nr:hypothetical protein [Comamonas thiooxydans]